MVELDRVISVWDDRACVLIADGSALVRRALGNVLKEDPRLHIIKARNMEETLRRCREDRPRVILLDIDLPSEGGLECLERIMASCPRPVLVLGNREDTARKRRALMKGARAFVAYEGASSQKIKDISEQLLRKVLEVAELDPLSVEREPLFEVEPLQARWIRHTGQRSAARPLGKFSSAAQRVRGGRPKPRLVLVGSSTGGPRALQEVLSALPPDFPSPILVAQHMPGSFTRRLAQRLDQACSLHVQEVREPIEMIPGGVYIAQGDMDVQVELIQGVLRAIPVDKDTSLHFHPSVERMVCSSLESCWPRALVGVMLSGMGDDGAKAMTQLKFKGGATIAESQESAVVFGMPQALVASHGATVVLHCKQIADQLLEWARYGVGFDSSTG